MSPKSRVLSPESRVLSLECLVVALVAQRLRLAHVDPDVPLARLGLDSLGCVELAADLESAIEMRVPLDAVTESTTLRSLCAAITADPSSSAFDLMREDAVLPADIAPRAGRALGGGGSVSLTTARHILLTGATGFLGSELLDRLFARTGARITCLTRAGRAVPHHRARVELVTGDLTQPRAGLSDEDWERLAASIDSICHAGASINWIGSYEALRDVNVLGTRELLRLAGEAGASFHFISSVSVCYSTRLRREMNSTFALRATADTTADHGHKLPQSQSGFHLCASRYGGQDGAAGVQPITDESFDALTAIEGLHFGYAQTKAVAESLVGEAARRGLDARIYRPALITGDSRTGRFNPDDLLTALVAGCVRMGAAPDLDWQLDGLPVDTVTDLILGLSGTSHRAVHLVHPRPRHWRECVLWMRLYGYDVRLVPYREWTWRLRDAATGHPLRALRSFFLDEHEGGLTIPELHEETRKPCLGTERSAAMISTSGVSIPPLDAALLDTYFAAFVRDGKLPAPTCPPKREPRRWKPRSGEGGALRRPGGSHIAEPLLRDSGCDTNHLTVTPLAATDSIISELTAWRTGGATGLFDVRAGGRRYVLKIKPHADEAHAVGLALAGICGHDLSDAYETHGRGLGLEEGHERELAVYREADVVARSYMPHAIAVRADEATRTWAVLLEYFGDATLVDTVDRPAAWTRDRIETAIDGLAALHVSWHDRVCAVRRQRWIGSVRSTESMQRMTPLWRALADHASPMFSAWTGSSPAVQHDLLDRIAEWRPALEQLPQTLIHNDFNPRNVCLRERDGRPTLCAFDWELATIGAPVRDLAEFLCFVLPPDINRDVVGAMIDRHLRAFATGAKVAVDPHAWRAGFAAALCELLVDRLSVYAMVHRVKAQTFLPRVLLTWGTLHAMSRKP